MPLGLNVNDGIFVGCVDGFWVIGGTSDGGMDGGFVDGVLVGTPEDGTLLGRNVERNMDGEDEGTDELDGLTLGCATTKTDWKKQSCNDKDINQGV
jgi:hypothetical protein